MQKSTQDPDEKVDEVLSNLKGNIKAWSKKTETLEKKTLKSVGNKDQVINQIKKKQQSLSAINLVM